MNERSALKALVIGCIDEFWPVAEAVLARATSVRFETSLQHLADVGDFSPQLVLVCQRWPEEYSSEFVAELMATFPVSRLLCVYGDWCASDGRTRSLWPPALRVPLSDVAIRISLEVEVIRGLRPPLPVTAGLDEIFAFHATR